MYGAIQAAYDHFNECLFDNKLPGCVFTLVRTGRQMACVHFDRWMTPTDELSSPAENITTPTFELADEICLNPEYFLNMPISGFCQTLVHEMVHIWQHHFGRPRRNYHNKQWSEKMKKIGLYPSLTGKPGGDTEGHRVGDYIVLEGQFYQACEQLLINGFYIPWVLRYYSEQTEAAANLAIYDSDHRPVKKIKKVFLKTFKEVRQTKVS